MRDGLWMAALGVVLPMSAGHAWHDEGHYIKAHLSVAALPDDVPAFVRDGAAVVGQGSIDPDVNKIRGFPELRAAEAPEHYFDYEFFEGEELPRSRHRFMTQARERGLDPYEVGLLPYAVTEWTQRLTIAFAEHLAEPECELARQRCLLYAGHLMHYAHDLTMPLHVTVHHDGRVDPATREGERTGIHRRVDGLYKVAEVDAAAALGAVEPRAYEDVFAAVMDELRESFALVDRTYELEAEHGFVWHEEAEPGDVAEAVQRFADERMEASVRFGSSLILTAWRDAAEVRLPWWLDREGRPAQWRELIEGEIEPAAAR